MVLIRLQRVAEWLAQAKLDGFIFESGTDFFYLTGKKLSAGRILVTEKRSTLFVDGRYFESCRDVKGCDLVLTPHFEKNSPFHEALKTLGGRIGFDSKTTTVASFEKLKGLTDVAKWIPSPNPATELRQIKDSDEIELLQRAAQLNEQGMAFVQKRLRVGVGERELARALQIFWLESGGDEVAFEPIIAFGENSALPHHRASDRKLKRGDTVLIDIGVKKNGYVSDMTKTLFFGPISDKMAQIYKIVEEAQKLALDRVVPGTPLSFLDRAARSHIEKAGYGAHFCHGLGHGIGLEIHELPYLRQTQDDDLELKEGMAITIEPGIYLPQVGGVRLEQSVVVVASGFLPLGVSK